MPYGPLTTPSRGNEIRAGHVSQLTAIVNAATSGKFLKSTGSGQVDWISPAATDVSAVAGAANRLARWSVSSILGYADGLHWDDTLQYLGLGLDPAVRLHVLSSTDDTQVHIEGDGHTAITRQWTFLSGAAGSAYIGVKARGSRAAPRRVKTDDEVVALVGSGHFAADDATNATLGSAMPVAVRGMAGEDWTSTARGAYLTLNTTALGSTTRTERWRVSPAGHLLAGADNSYDYGATGASRPRSIYAAGLITSLEGTATTAGGAKALGLGAAGPHVYVGSGAPTISAVKGSLYLRTDGSGTSSRAYINTDGSTTWTAITTAA